MLEYTVKVWANGTREWYLNGKRHREDGPAIEWASGHKQWFVNGGMRAIEWSDGTKLWYLNGKRSTEQDVARIGGIGD